MDQETSTNINLGMTSHDHSEATSKPWDFTLMHSDGEVLTLETAVYQAIGGASSCWENKDLLRAGVFQDGQAAQIAERLIKAIREGEIVDTGRSRLNTNVRHEDPWKRIAPLPRSSGTIPEDVDTTNVGGGPIPGAEG